MTFLTEKSIPKLTENAFQSMEEYSAAISHLKLQGRQLSKGDFNGTSHMLSADDFHIGIRTAEVKHLQTAHLDSGHIGMIFPIQSSNYIHNGKIHCDDTQIIAYDNSESTIIFPKNHKHLMLLFNSDKLDNYLSESEIELFFNACKHLAFNKVSTRHKTILTQHLCHLYKNFKNLINQPQNLLAYQDCYESLFYALNEYHSFHTEVDMIKISNKERLLSRALDYISHSDLKTLTASSLIKGIHASSRSIQYCFSELLGMTAKKYIIITRLNAIRSELQDSSPNEQKICTIANKFGVVNMGRFKQDYENFFNESPRDTLNKT